jgi:hypothetical protein
MRRPAGAVAIAALVAIAAGCGGSGGGDASRSGGNEFSARANPSVTTVKLLTKPKFIAHVNSLCRRKWRFILNAVRQTSVITGKLHPQTSKMQRYARGVRLSYFASIAFHIYVPIQRLGAPPGERQAVEKLIGTMLEGIERGGRQVRFASAAQAEAPFADYNRTARRYGLDECLVAGAHLPHPEA